MRSSKNQEHKKYKRIFSAGRTAACLACLACFTLLGWLPFAPGIHAQDNHDITSGIDPAFDAPGRMRPAVSFDHDAHNKAAHLDEDCTICHHLYENGKLIEDEPSAGIPCSECHMDKGKKGLIKAYHEKCIGCHEQRMRGPVMCAECHRR